MFQYSMALTSTTDAGPAAALTCGCRGEYRSVSDGAAPGLAGGRGSG